MLMASLGAADPVQWPADDSMDYHYAATGYNGKYEHPNIHILFKSFKTAGNNLHAIYKVKYIHKVTHAITASVIKVVGNVQSVVSFQPIIITFNQ